MAQVKLARRLASARLNTSIWRWEDPVLPPHRLGIDRRLSTAFHPESDGQAERENSVMKQYL